MTALHTLAEIEAAGAALAAGWPIATQQKVDQWAALKAPWLPRLAQAQAA